MITRFDLAVFLVRKEGNNPLKTIKCLVFLICPTLVPSLGGASLICHLSGPPQSPKVSKNTIKITSFCHAVILMSKEANSLLKAIKCLAYLSHPVMMVVVAVVWMQKNINIQSCSFSNIKNTQNIKFLQI